MKKVFALVISSLLVLAGCASEPEFGEVSSSMQHSQEMQAYADPTQQEVEPEVTDTEESQGHGPQEAAEEGQREQEEFTPNPIAYELAAELVDDEMCMLRETSSYRSTNINSLASSFPAATGMSLPRIGTIKVKVVFIQWEDLPGTQGDYYYNLWSAKTFSEFYRVMSEGKLNLEVTAEPEWISVGQSWEADVVPAGMEGGSWQSRQYLRPFIDKIIEAVDPRVDFTDVDVILFGTPSAEIVVDSLHIFGVTEVPAYTNEGTIQDMFSLGRRIYEHKDSQPGWAQYAHEFGHSLGIPDLRNWTKGQRGVPMHFISPMFGHEIMDNQNSGSRSISGWIKWVQGWLSNAQVTCIDAANVDSEYYKLNPANIVGAPNQLLTIRVSETKLIAVESTRWDSKFDLRSNQKTDGIIVYTVDSTLGHQEGPLKLLSPRDIAEYLSDDHIWPDWRVLDVILFTGDEVEIDGIRITNVQSEDSGDTVLVEDIS
jgi:M6 family metalloprotease-like protein